jgi:hypothetical protein
MVYINRKMFRGNVAKALEIADLKTMAKAQVPRMFF